VDWLGKCWNSSSLDVAAPGIVFVASDSGSVFVMIPERDGEPQILKLNPERTERTNLDAHNTGALAPSDAV
jgi:hypothetical protein